MFFVMGYADGETAGELVRWRGPLPALQAVRILRDAALALGYGHARGVVHRDVKPDNTWGAIFAPIAYALIQRARATRRVLAMGFGTGDLSAALLDEMDRKHDELDEIEVRPSNVVKALRWIAVGSLALSVVGFAVMSWVLSTVDLSNPRDATLAQIAGQSFIGFGMTTLAAGLLAEMITPSKVLFRAGTFDLSWRPRGRHGDRR